MLTQERLKELLDYDPESGIFYRKTNAANRGLFIGDVAGYIRKGHNYGYVLIKIGKKAYHGHRLAWLYVHGKFPDNHIDHINNIRHDNRISNLREATNSQNTMNSSIRSDNSSGYRGVNWDKATNKWKARIMKNGKRVVLGYFDNIYEAHLVYERASLEYFGEFKFSGEDKF